MKFGIDWPNGFSEKMMIENAGHIHVYCPGAGADNPPEVNFFHHQYFSVNIVLCCKFSPIK